MFSFFKNFSPKHIIFSSKKIIAFFSILIITAFFTLLIFFIFPQNQVIPSEESDFSFDKISHIPWNFSSEMRRLKKYEETLNNKVKVLDAILTDLEKNEVITDTDRKVEDKNKRAGLKSNYKLGIGGVEFNDSPRKPKHQDEIAPDDEIKKSEKVSILSNEFEKQITKISSLPLGSPVSGSLTSGFGWRTSPFKWKTKFHQGVDISVERNTPITATADGIVIEAGYRGGYGNSITIQHRDGYQTVYAHLEKILVSTGDKVCRGTKIGNVGVTGNSTGPHLHYEILKENTAVDPWKFIQTAQLIKQIIKKDSQNS